MYASDKEGTKMTYEKGSSVRVGNWHQAMRIAHAIIRPIFKETQNAISTQNF